MAKDAQKSQRPQLRHAVDALPAEKAGASNLDLEVSAARMFNVYVCLRHRMNIDELAELQAAREAVAVEMKSRGLPTPFEPID